MIAQLSARLLSERLQGFSIGVGEISLPYRDFGEFPVKERQHGFAKLNRIVILTFGEAKTMVISTTVASTNDYNVIVTLLYDFLDVVPRGVIGCGKSSIPAGKQSISRTACMVARRSSRRSV